MNLKSSFLKLVKKKNRFQSPLDFKELQQDFIDALECLDKIKKSKYVLIEGFVHLYGYDKEPHQMQAFSVPTVGVVDSITGETTLYSIYKLVPKLLEHKNERFKSDY